MRIRSIKPEFWRSEDVWSLPDDATRLLFVGLWSYVDDNGVGRGDPRIIVADLYALDADPRERLATVSRGLQALSDASLVTLYEVDGRAYLFITGWDKHQKIDRPSKPRYPRPTWAHVDPPGTLATPSRQSRDGLDAGTGEQGNRGTGEQGGGSVPNQTSPARDEASGSAGIHPDSAARSALRLLPRVCPEHRTEMTKSGACASCRADQLAGAGPEAGTA